MAHYYIDAYLSKKPNESSTTPTMAPVVATHLEWPPPKKSCVLDISSQPSFIIAFWFSSVVQTVKCFPQKYKHHRPPSTLSLQLAPSASGLLISWNANQHLPEGIIISSSMLNFTNEKRPCPPSTTRPWRPLPFSSTMSSHVLAFQNSWSPAMENTLRMKSSKNSLHYLVSVTSLLHPTSLMPMARFRQSTR